MRNIPIFIPTTGASSSFSFVQVQFDTGVTNACSAEGKRLIIGESVELERCYRL
jgi:hypothetical protein